MALVQETLSKALTATFVEGMRSGATALQQAIRVSNDYDAYASSAQSCAPAPPSVVNLSTLKDQLYEAFRTPYREPVTPATRWANAFEAYWEGGKFGATGEVTTIPGTAQLKADLVIIFTTPTRDSYAAVARRIATALHSFTTQIVVTDTTTPPPSGCTGPIT
jgi:hypothetical protein